MPGLQTGDPGLIAAADQTARHWRYSQRGDLRPGSAAHASACRAMFLETFNPYRPTILNWPVLDQPTRERLIRLPIWDIAVQTEGKARLRMLAYAATLTDPAWRDTVELNGWEEGRHRVVLANLVQAYGIALAPEPTYFPPRDPEWAYMVTGYSECIDSFFAFGLFAMAERSGLFPPELVETFEPVMQEECRHILLFANWMAARRASMQLWRRPWFELKVWAVWVFLAWERTGIARGMEKGEPGSRAGSPDNNFTVTGAKAVSDVELAWPDLMALCLAENDRRFAGYDHRLRRPTTMPFLVRTALGVLRRLGRLKPTRKVPTA
ncbi:MAG: ferritin-like domain-containing protein [Acidocella sp.]|nr:ferritin-like domain-containing protein [Acidocella sp.]